MPKKISNNSEDSNLNEQELELTVVGIGASAGGLEALQDLVKNLPKEAQVAYIIAQHLSPTYKSMMVDLLSKGSTLPVEEAIHNRTIAPGVIYVCPPNKNITVSKEKIMLSTPESTRVGPKPSIDLLFESLAYEKGAKAVGIILSGTGTDGARGIRMIKAETGFTFVQDPTTAKYDGMPNAAIQTTKVDFVLHPEEMGNELTDLLIYPRKIQPVETSDREDSIYKLIFKKLKDSTKTDFSQYKNNTLHRRIERRMAALKLTSLVDYNNYLQKNSGETELLYKNILIGVTAFFRDTKAFELLRGQLENIVTQKENHLIRVWVPGCSTGEEVYTIAIILHELIGSEIYRWKIQIFATDIDEDALAIARKGRYPESALLPLSKEQREKYFTIADEQFSVVKSLREMVIFSRHDLLGDPPFLKLDLISCRNLLIYFNQETQRKLVPLFHYSLNDGGLLFLGKSESIGQFHSYFSTIDNRWRVYRANYLGDDHAPRDVSSTPVFSLPSRKTERIPGSQNTQTLRELLAEKVHQSIVPMCILINEVQDIVFSGGENPYLTRPSGASTDNVFKNVHSGLVTELRVAMQTAGKEQKIVKTPYISIELYPTLRRIVRMTVVPVLSTEELRPTTLIYFQEEDPEDLAIIGTGKSANENSDERVQQLETELLRTQNQMQTLVEELETSNEELQSMNEELQSANEELQSTNEELETTNEELQSTNEELQTAYSELRALYTEAEVKAKTLADTQDDLKIVNAQFQLAQEVSNTGHFEWFVEENRCEWSKQMFKIFDVEPGLATPSIDIVLARIHPDDRALVEAEMTKAVTSGKFDRQYRLRFEDGHVAHVHGVATVTEREEGRTKLVGTVQDVSDLYRLRQRADRLEARMNDLMNGVLAGVYLFDVNRNVTTYINPAYTRITGYSIEDIEAQNSGDFLELIHPDDVGLIKDHIKQVIASQEGEVITVQYRFKHKDGHWITLQSVDTVFSSDANDRCVEFFGSFVEVISDE